MGKYPPWGGGQNRSSCELYLYTKYVKLTFCVTRLLMFVIIFWALAHATQVTVSLFWGAHCLSDVQTHKMDGRTFETEKCRVSSIVLRFRTVRLTSLSMLISRWLSHTLLFPVGKQRCGAGQMRCPSHEMYRWDASDIFDFGHLSNQHWGWFGNVVFQEGWASGRARSIFMPFILNGTCIRNPSYHILVQK